MISSKKFSPPGVISVPSNLAERKRGGIDETRRSIVPEKRSLKQIYLMARLTS